MLFLLIGRMASGKDYLRQILEDQYGWTFAKSCTTRERRFATENTHVFLSQEEADKIPDSEKAAETVINEAVYFATKEQVRSHDGYIIDPKGMKMLLKNMPDETIVPAYISVKDENQQKQMAVNRAVNHVTESAVFDKRYADEDKEFSAFEEHLPFNSSDQKFFKEHYPNVQIESDFLPLVNDYQPDTMQRIAAMLEQYRQSKKAE